jgi:hypothetical protein
MDSKTAFQNLMQLLKEIAAKLQILERQAAESLTPENNHDQYRKFQEEKTRLLISLPTRVADHLSGIEPQIQTTIEKGLLEFAEDAQMAQKVNSLFYMSVLLAPEENQEEADRNSFDSFIAKLESI